MYIIYHKIPYSAFRDISLFLDPCSTVSRESPYGLDMPSLETPPSPTPQLPPQLP
jgi:hypothetical protein